MFYKKRINLIVLLLLPQAMYGMFTVEYKKAIQITDQQWEILEQSWITIFADAYKGLENAAVDKKIRGDTQGDVAIWLKEQFHDYRQRTFDNDLSTYVLLYDDRELVGYAVFVLWPNQSLIHVPQIAVMIDYQSRGVGKALMKAIFEYPSECKSVVLTTRILNNRAQTFYKKMGFYQVCESIENIPCDFEYSVLLRKDM